jgi:hypothetical protein
MMQGHIVNHIKFFIVAVIFVDTKNLHDSNEIIHE